MCLIQFLDFLPETMGISQRFSEWPGAVMSRVLF